jgi:ATP phosphoribosyltransferase
MNRTLALGLPKGSLEKSTLELFARAGWRIAASERNYFPDIDDPEIVCTLVKAREMAHYVAGGTLDAGLTGRDWCVEYDADVVVAEDSV